MSVILPPLPHYPRLNQEERDAIRLYWTTIFGAAAFGIDITQGKTIVEAGMAHIMRLLSDIEALEVALAVAQAGLIAQGDDEE